jgi:hypothetical protein
MLDMQSSDTASLFLGIAASLSQIHPIIFLAFSLIVSPGSFPNLG